VVVSAITCLASPVLVRQLLIRWPQGGNESEA
jgi:hypothetical protein